MLDINDMKWWLLSDVDYRILQKILSREYYANDLELQEALHILETGIHETDVVPRDYNVITDDDGYID